MLSICPQLIEYTDFEEHLGIAVEEASKAVEEAEEKPHKPMMIMNLDFKKFAIIPETGEAEPTESKKSKPPLQRKIQ